MNILPGFVTLTLLTTLTTSAPTTPPPGVSTVVSLGSSTLSASGPSDLSSSEVRTTLLPAPTTSQYVSTSGVGYVVTDFPLDSVTPTASLDSVTPTASLDSVTPTASLDSVTPTASPDSVTPTASPDAVLKESPPSGSGQGDITAATVVSEDTPISGSVSSSNADITSGPTEKEITAVRDALRDSFLNQVASANKNGPQSSNVIQFPVALEVDLVPDVDNTVDSKQLSPL